MCVWKRGWGGVGWGARMAHPSWQSAGRMRRTVGVSSTSAPSTKMRSRLYPAALAVTATL